MRSLLAIGSDHAGFALKKYLISWLEPHQLWQSVDIGTFNEVPVDYPDFAEAVGLAVRQGKAVRGLLICGSGVGATVAANKIKGIRACVCHDTYSARQSVEHDNANILVLGERVIGVKLAEELVQAFLMAGFSGEERHVRRLRKIAALEDRFGP